MGGVIVMAVVASNVLILTMKSLSVVLEQHHFYRITRKNSVRHNTATTTIDYNYYGDRKDNEYRHDHHRRASTCRSTPTSVPFTMSIRPATTTIHIPTIASVRSPAPLSRLNYDDYDAYGDS